MSKRVQRAAENTAAEMSRETERIRTELSFAHQLAEIHRGKAKQWKPLIERATDVAEKGAASGSLADLRRAVAAAEKILEPVGKLAKTYTVHCVGHAHIDMNWMWSWPETVAIVVDTVGTVLTLMDEYPDFRFSQSQASIYAILDEYRPDLLRRVAQRVHEGRWEVTASHWVECDKNMSAGESLARHLLYTRQYMHRLFALQPEDVPVDWSCDTFGHAATVPTYLVRGGVKYLYLHRPGTRTEKKPWLFRWKGPDGSMVLVKNDHKIGYGHRLGTQTLNHLVDFVKETGLRDFMVSFGVGDHGGGPTRLDIERAIAMNRWPICPNIRFSTARRYFETVAPQAARLPVIDTELNFEFAGCYTSQSLIKKANRFGENRLLDAETAAVLSWLGAGFAFSPDRFDTGWRQVMFNQFHDILPGSGVMDTRTYAHGLYQNAVALTSQIETAALRRLAAKVNTLPAQAGPPADRERHAIGAGVGFGSRDGNLSGADQTSGRGDRPFVLFNPTGTDRREIVELTLWETGRTLKGRAFWVRLPNGRALPCQVVGAADYWGHENARILVPASVPGFGYSSCLIVEEPPETVSEPESKAWHIGAVHHCSYSLPERSAEGLENDLIRVEIDPQTGGIVRLLDKRGNVELVAPDKPAPVLEYEVERPHGMSSWLVQQAGAPPEYPQVANLRRVLQGPYKATIQIDLKIHESEFTVSYELNAGDPRLHVGIAGTWFQRGTPATGVPALNFVLPLAVEKAKATYEIPFGAVERDLNRREEVPGLQWANVRGRIGKKKAGCLLVNDSKHGHSLDGSTLRLSLIRSSYEPDILPEIGRHEIRLAVEPYAGDLPVADAIRRGQVFNRAIRAVGTDVHRGALPPVAQFIRVEPAAAMVSAIKKSEDGNGMIARLFNPTPRPLAARIRLDGKLAPSIKKVQEVDLMERPTPRSTARIARGVVTVAIPAHGIVSVRLDLA